MIKVVILCSALFMFSCSEKSKENTPGSSQTAPDSVSTEKDESVLPNEQQGETEKDSDENVDSTTDWTETSLRAYIFDPDDQPTNIRNKPGGDVIYQLSKGDNYEVTLTGVSDGWFTISEVVGEEEGYDIPREECYIHGSVLAVDTRNYGGEEIDLYEDATENSSIVATINQEAQFTLKSADGEWIKVRWHNNGKPLEGWIKRKWLCGSLRTNCS